MSVLAVLILVLAFMAPTAQATGDSTVPCTRAGQQNCTIPDYDRKAQFGSGWVIVRGRCDTREIVLERDAATKAVDTDKDGCADDGPIADAWTGKIVFPVDAEIDHVFAEEAAWIAGAFLWTQARRLEFAQDRDNLRAVLGTENSRKGARGPGSGLPRSRTYRPPDRRGWCVYAETYRRTAVRYDLAVTDAQNAALNDMIATCAKSVPAR